MKQYAEWIVKSGKLHIDMFMTIINDAINQNVTGL